MTDPVSRVSRVLMRGPLAPFAEEYRDELLARGYTPRTAVNQLRQVLRLSCWLGDHGLGPADASEERISYRTFGPAVRRAASAPDSRASSRTGAGRQRESPACP
jgi:hypothetical protein